MKNKIIDRASPGLRFGSANRVGSGLEVATLREGESGRKSSYDRARRD